MMLKMTVLSRKNNVVQHRDDEYDQDGFDVLANATRTLWHRCRHKFSAAVRQGLMKQGGKGKGRWASAIDLGGGRVTGILSVHAPMFSELALAILHTARCSAARGRPFAGVIKLTCIISPNSDGCCISPDVIEHMPDDIEALTGQAPAARWSSFRNSRRSRHSGHS
jgi:hypothetical protein